MVAAAQDRFDNLGIDVVKRASELVSSPETKNTVLVAASAFDDLVSRQTQAATKAFLASPDGDWNQGAFVFSLVLMITCLRYISLLLMCSN
ncbi:hypothetical protein PMIN01_05065 [Paraphaeosphaeria minitans]|uniref:Uncharacterized protein n=1 Tax=Paraphaeosphaeria minitans TaxID=565426 RepID=A0A9P6GKE2_9PLEO|nr:hypothetical protein PMIN01_05065 [Paraphaeosphaeria minitans]